MSAAAIGGVSSSVGSANKFAEIQSADFIKILTTEMANQDPFNPQDSSALLEQLSSLRNIESQLVLQQKLESLVLQNQVSVASGMIGKVVLGLTEDNERISGLVQAVRIENGKAVLELDSGQALTMDRVTNIMPLQS